MATEPSIKKDGSAILRRRNRQYVHVKTRTYGATCRRFRRRTLNPNRDPNPNPNPIFSRNRNKVFERKQKRHPNIGQYIYNI